MSVPISWGFNPPRDATDVEYAATLAQSLVYGVRECGIKRPHAIQIVAAYSSVSERTVRRLVERDTLHVSQADIGWLRGARARLAHSIAAWHARRVEYWRSVAKEEEASAAGTQLAFEEARKWKKATPTKPAAPEYDLELAA